MSNAKSFVRLKPIAIGIVCGVLCSAIILSLSSLLFVLTGVLIESALDFLSYIILAFSAFISGYVAGKLARQGGMVYGLISGLFIFGIIFFGGLISASATLTFVSLIKCIISLLFGSLGGIAGVNKR